MNEAEIRYTHQIERFARQVQALDYLVTLLHMDDGHPAPGLRIHIQDEAAELLCVYTPLADIEGLEDLDILNLILTRNEKITDHRRAAEAVIVAVNEICICGHFGLRADGDLYYRAEFITERDELPEITSFADSLKLVFYADTALRPAILQAGEGADPEHLIAELRG